MRTYNSPTLTDLHEQMTKSLLFASSEELDHVSNVDVAIHDVMGKADSMAWDFDLKSMWLTKSRWTMMARQYIDPDELVKWIEMSTGKIGLKGRGIAVMRTKVVKPRGGAATGHTNKETRRWGSCMLNLSYKAIPTPTITLHSRTSYLGYIGALDLSVAWMCARYLGHELGIPPEAFTFIWHIEAIQWHNFKSLAWMLNHVDPKQRDQYRRYLIKPVSKLTAEEVDLITMKPAVKMTRAWHRKMMASDAKGETYGDMSYNTYRRIRRRWHTEVLGYERAQTFEGWSLYKQGPKLGEQKEFFKAYQPLPSVSIHSLDFSCLKLPFGKGYGMEFEGEMEEDDDDE
ncbi:hypothetical protein ACWIG4_30370 [Streptomyces sp. NPDC002248]